MTARRCIVLMLSAALAASLGHVATARALVPQK